MTTCLISLTMTYTFLQSHPKAFSHKFWRHLDI